MRGTKPKSPFFSHFLCFPSTRAGYGPDFPHDVTGFRDGACTVVAIHAKYVGQKVVRTDVIVGMFTAAPLSAKL